MLEDESVIEDEDVFQAYPENTCFVLVGGGSVSTTKKMSQSSSDAKQQRLTFEGGSLDIRPPTEQVRNCLCI